MTYQLVSIILPVYRQAGEIESIVRTFEQRLASFGLPHETLLIINGPDDGSAAICQDLEATCSAVRAIKIQSKGWGEAVRHGIRLANGDLICYTNSARTNVDTLLLTLDLARSLPGLVVKANRKTRDSMIRHLGSLLYNLECRSLFDLSNFDINGTPKVFPADFGSLQSLQSRGDLLDVEFLAMCRREGHLVLEIPTVLTSRGGGTSTTNLKSAIGMYVGAILLAFRWRSLRSGRPR